MVDTRERKRRREEHGRCAVFGLDDVMLQIVSQIQLAECPKVRAPLASS